MRRASDGFVLRFWASIGLSMACGTWIGEAQRAWGSNYLVFAWDAILIVGTPLVILGWWITWLAAVIERRRDAAETLGEVVG